MIAIGVGCYDHLSGGTKRKTKFDLGLGQLSSPPVSARAIATWFIENFDCADYPLGSVSLVVSEQTPTPFKNTRTGQEYNVPSGSINDVREALKNWIARAEVDARNRIILYFCGHGLSAGVQNYYLMRDYGSDDEDPLLGALNFNNFKTGLSWKKPSLQFLLFDACRSPNSMIDLNRDGGQSIFVADPTGRLNITETVQQCPIFSTELDRSALGRPQEASLCAQAFLRAMSGACCKKEDGQWYVTTHRMVEALSDFQNRESEKSGKTQSADASSYAKIRLRRLRNPPRIPVFVRLDDPDLCSKVKVTITKGANPPCCTWDPASPEWVDCKEWETTLEIGDYNFVAHDIVSAHDPVVLSDTVIPTHIEVTLEVKPWAP